MKHSKKNKKVKVKNCIDCGQKISMRGEKNRCKRCARKNYLKLHPNIMKGKNNPNHKGWSKNKVIKVIKEKGKKNEDLKASTVRDTNLPLFKAARRYYKSWEAAIKEAGLDYDAIRGDRKTTSYKGLIFEKLVKKIYKLSKTNVTESPYFSYKNDICIPDFIEKDTDKWVEVKYRAWSAGVEETINKYLKYKNKLLILYLTGDKRRWHTDKVKFINVFDYFPILKKPKYKSIKEELNLLAKTEKSQKKFKIWSKKWSKDKIIKTIRKLYKENHPLNVYYMECNYHKLSNAANKYFGSYKEAIKETGLDYSKICKKKGIWTKKELITYLKKQIKNGKLPGYLYFKKIGELNIYTNALKKFSSRNKILEVLNLPSGPIIYKTYKEAKKAVQKLNIKNAKDYHRKYKEDSCLSATPDIIYADKGWVDWYDFLGKNKKILYNDYKQAKTSVRKLGIKTKIEYEMRHKEDSYLPSNPNQKYKDKGWKNWRNFLREKE